MLAYRPIASAIAIAALLSAAPNANAAFVYSDTTNFTGFGYAVGGATLQGNDLITNLVADDINPAAGFAGQGVTSFSFSVANFNSSTVTARALIRLYNNDGAGGGPGTLLAAIDFAPISFGTGVTVFTTSSATPYFTLPSGTFWAGITFDNNNGLTGATAAQLNGLGQGIYAPPTVGTSSDLFFQTTAPGSFAGNNPAGGFFFFGGNPQADFGWSFQTTDATLATPAPSGLVLGLVGAVVFGLGRLRRRVS